MQILSSKKIYFTLLPLVIVLCLSCPIKQEIKQVLNVPIGLLANLDKGNDYRACTAALSKTGKNQKSKIQIDKKHQLSLLLLAVSTDNAVANSISEYSSTQKNTLPVPLFIFHRKLII